MIHGAKWKGPEPELQKISMKHKKKKGLDRGMTWVKCLSRNRVLAISVQALAQQPGSFSINAWALHPPELTIGHRTMQDYGIKAPHQIQH